MPVTAAIPLIPAHMATQTMANPAMAALLRLSDQAPKEEPACQPVATHRINLYLFVMSANLMCRVARRLNRKVSDFGRDLDVCYDFSTSVTIAQHP